MSLTSFLWQSSLTSPALSEPTNPSPCSHPTRLEPLALFSNAPPPLPPPSLNPTHPPPAHKHAFTFFLSELFRSLSLSVTDTKGTNTNVEQKVNNLAECNSGGSLKQKRKEKGEKKMKEICGLQVSRGHLAECFLSLWKTTESEEQLA